jgi:hypothetical protein
LWTFEFRLSQVALDFPLSSLIQDIAVIFIATGL